MEFLFSFFSLPPGHCCIYCYVNSFPSSFLCDSYCCIMSECTDWLHQLSLNIIHLATDYLSYGLDTTISHYLPVSKIKNFKLNGISVSRVKIFSEIFYIVFSVITLFASGAFLFTQCRTFQGTLNVCVFALLESHKFMKPFRFTSKS